MDLEAMISELAAERQRIDEAILALERFSQAQSKRRGRPPKWLLESEPKPAAAKSGGRKPRKPAKNTRSGADGQGVSANQ